MLEYDFIIIGGGVVGSSTAYTLSKEEAKKKVLLLEQFPVPHTRGSSTGQTRVFRCFYPHNTYGRMCYDAMSMWKTLENETDEKLLLNNRYVEIYEKKSTYLNQCLQVLNHLQVPYEHMNAEEIRNKYKVFNFPNRLQAINEHTGGTLMATKSVLALQKQFVKNGGTIHDSEKVFYIKPNDNDVIVTTSKRQYKTKSLIITAGSYTQELTKQLGLNLPLRIERTFACYWKLSDPLIGSLASGFPTWFYKGIYGLAVHEYPGLMKICDHTGVEVDINRPNDVHPNIENVVKFIKEYTTGVEDKPTIIEKCLYTITPDRHFILDKHPLYKNVIIGAGFSGGGFKMAPVTGKVLADLAMDKEPAYDISIFRLNRFDNILRTKL